MSLNAYRWAWKMPVTHSEKLVLLALAECSDEDGIAWPGNAQIMDMTGLKERAIRSARKSLEQAGMIQSGLEGRRHKVRLCLHLSMCDLADSAGKPANIATSKPAKFATNSADIAKKSANIAASNKNRKEPSKNHHTPYSPPKASKPASKPEQEFALPDWVPSEAWNGWLEMRRSMKKPATTRAMEIAVKRLDELRAQGQDPGQVLDNCTLQGWQGIYPLKNSRPHSQQAAPRMSESERNRAAIFEEIRAQYRSQDHADSDRIVFQ